MTDDLTALDTRGLAAGRLLRAAAAVHPVPVFDPDVLPLRVPVDGPVRRGGGRTGGSDGPADPADPHGPGRRRWIALVGVAAALALLAGVVVLRAAGGDDDGAPVDDVEVGPRGVAAHVVDPPPEGLDLAAPVEPWGEAAALVPGGPGDTLPEGPRAVLYGPEPTGTPGLAVVAVDAWAGGGTVPAPDGGGPMPTEAAGLEPVDIGEGRRAWATPPMWLGPPSVLVAVGDAFARVYRAGAGSRPASGPRSVASVDDVLLAAAAAVVVDPEARRATIDPDGLPTGWAEQAEVPSAGVTRTSVVGRAAGAAVPVDGYVAVYGDALLDLDPEAPGPDVRGAVVSVAPGTEQDLATRRFWGSWFDEVEVQGHRAVVVTHLGAELDEVSVSWLAEPGVLVEVAVTGLTRDEALALAARVRPATAAEVDAARAAELETRLAEVGGGEVLLGRGRLSDGRGWGLVAHGGEGLTDGATLVVAGPPTAWACGAAEGDPQVSAGADAPAVGITCTGTTGEVATGLGRVRADVAEVALVDLDAPGGSTEVDRVAVLEAEGWAGFVVERPDPGHRYRVLALDAEGEQIGSARLGVS